MHSGLDKRMLLACTSCCCRVLPSTVPRSCFTIWMSQGKTRAADVLSAAAAAPPPHPPAAAGDSPVSSESVSQDMWRFLMQPAVRQHVCKLAYEGEALVTNQQYGDDVTGCFMFGLCDDCITKVDTCDQLQVFHQEPNPSRSSSKISTTAFWLSWGLMACSCACAWCCCRGVEAIHQRIAPCLCRD